MVFPNFGFSTLNLSVLSHFRLVVSSIVYQVLIVFESLNHPNSAPYSQHLGVPSYGRRQLERLKSAERLIESLMAETKQNMWLLVTSMRMRSTPKKQRTMNQLRRSQASLIFWKIIEGNCRFNRATHCPTRVPCVTRKGYIVEVAWTK